MPADRRIPLPIGGGGLNLKSAPPDLGPEELSDSLNWQLDRSGAITKRLGLREWSVQAPAAILELMTLRISGGATYLLAHCDDGHVYVTTDGSAWTDIDSGLSPTDAVGWTQYQDTIYYSDADHAMRSWNGVTLVVQPAVDTSDVQTVTITGTPTSGDFQLVLNGESATINYNSTSTQMQTALVGLSSVDAGDVICTGGPLPGTGIVCTFGGQLAARPVAVMTTTDSLAGGTAPASHVAHTTTGAAIVPSGNILTVWRNRLFVSGVPATPRRVFWSVIGNPVSFINKLNYVEFASDTAVTAMTTIQNVVETPDGADGVIVFSEGQMHRIWDDSDNLLGTETGGANSLVDNAIGCVGRRSVVDMQGQIMFLSRDGVYSTNGHTSAKLESGPVDPIFRTFSWGVADRFVAANWRGRYLLSYTPLGSNANTRMLEVYADLPRRGTRSAQGSRQHGWYEWMAHDIPVTSYAVHETSLGVTGYIAHANPGDEAYVRLLFTGGYDISSDNVQNPITATARTGAMLLGTSGPKRLRLINLYGKGNVTVSVSADMESGAGEAKTFDMTTVTRTWSLSDSWGSGVWGGGGGAKNEFGYYRKRGRYLTFQLTETSTDSGEYDRSLGYAGAESGGAAIYSAILKITPLDGE